MEKKLIILSIAIKTDSNRDFILNEVQIRALLAGLCIVYSEAAIWITKKNMVVMVLGDCGELLEHAFLHFESQFKKMQVVQGVQAVRLLEKIADGNEWRQDTPSDKLNQLEVSQKLAQESESLGPVLSELMDTIMLRLKQAPVIVGNRNSWKYAGVKGIQLENRNVKVKVLRDTFFRFAIN